MSDLAGTIVAELPRRYDMGESCAPPERVWGGLQHRMYRLRTVRGSFAVKRLNPVVMGYENVRANFRFGEWVASAVLGEGIPAVPALRAFDGDILQDIAGDTVMVFPWMDAAPALPPGVVDAERAGVIGGILGRIHTLSLRSPDQLPPSGADEPASGADTEVTDAAEWARLLDLAERARLPVTSELRALLPQIAAWLRGAREARQSPLASGGRATWVISHRDLDPKNVLWANAHTPYLIDWEAAGYVQPAGEAVGAALDWSGQGASDAGVVAFGAFLDGYRQQAPLTPREIRVELATYCGGYCGWVKYNLARAIGTAPGDAEERDLGAREVATTLTMLRSAAVTLPALARQFPA